MILQGKTVDAMDKEEKNDDREESRENMADNINRKKLIQK